MGAFKSSMIRVVCITHLHTDHIIGLSGMILILDVSNETSITNSDNIINIRSNVNISNSNGDKGERKELMIYGPPDT